MIAAILYAPLAVALASLLFYVARGAVRGSGNGRLVPVAVVVAAALVGSLYLMFAADRPWAAVGVAAAVVGPVLAPAGILAAAVVIAWWTGKPIRWN